ncbi:flavin-dependent monooxygenase QhpG [Litorisediminicola beolgyonensis]|uniref:NAD(P)/FAD-dependent oxidoreductase n=1 Tax=Litorisediminicola beolgyonensis TaxID=1173614 RepID=A0ABW3ZHM4_9RHOB
MPLPDPEIVVLGGGPAGSSAALRLAVDGARVTIVSPPRVPATRLESLPVGGQALCDLPGLRRALDTSAVAVVARRELLWRERPETLEVTRDAPFLIDRARFDRACLAEAIRAGARLETSRARRDGPEIVLEDGRRWHPVAILDARGRRGLRARAPGLPQMVALPFRASDPSGVMRIAAVPDGWLWCAAGPQDRAEGALFCRAERVAGLDATERAALVTEALRSVGLLGAASGTPSAASLDWAETAMPEARVIRIGDRALARDPIAAHGLVHALRSAAQGSAAALTLLEGGNADAVREFVESRHRADVLAAKAVTEAAYASQARIGTGFWSDIARDPRPETASPPQDIDVTRRYALAAPLSRGAALIEGRIRWSPVIEFPASARRATHVGALRAETLTRLIGPPAPLGALLERLETQVPPTVARTIVRELLDGGALSPV